MGHSGLVVRTFALHLWGWGLESRLSPCARSLHVLPVLRMFPLDTLVSSRVREMRRRRIGISKIVHCASVIVPGDVLWDRLQAPHDPV